MADELLRYTMRVDRTLFKKFRYIAEYNGRSVNKEIIQYMKRSIAKFEEEHGEIPVTPKNNTDD